MPRVTNIEMIYKNEQPTLSIRVRTSMEKLSSVIDECYAKIGAYLGELSELPADMPFVAYHNMDMSDLDVEIGFPVSKPLPPKEDMQAGCIPAGKRILAVHRGPYSEVESTYNDMMAWIPEHGFAPVGLCYEHYFNDLSVPESELLTMVVMPLQS